jgi:hypothetical protein
LVKAGSSWEKYPSNMLFARAISSGVRIYCPDVFNGNLVYVPEELGAPVNEDGGYREGRLMGAVKVVNKATGEVIELPYDSFEDFAR